MQDFAVFCEALPRCEDAAEAAATATETTLVVGDAAKDAAFSVREAVFMREQGYQDEFDEIDNTCVHIALMAAGVAIGSARTFPEPAGSTRWAIGRIAVLPRCRKGGFGRMLVQACEQAAIEGGATELCLHAQARLEGWYGAMGYTRFGEVDYEDEGQPHIWMEKML